MRPDEPALGTAQPTSCTFDPKLTAKRTSLQFIGLPASTKHKTGHQHGGDQSKKNYIQHDKNFPGRTMQHAKNHTDTTAEHP
jgi:hypothetical protein